MGAGGTIGEEVRMRSGIKRGRREKGRRSDKEEEEGNKWRWGDSSGG